MHAKQLAGSVSTVLLLFVQTAISQGDVPKNFRELIFKPGQLKPVDSILNVKVGEAAPDFTLPSIQGQKKHSALFCTCSMDPGLL